MTILLNFINAVRNEIISVNENYKQYSYTYLIGKWKKIFKKLFIMDYYLCYFYFI